MFFRICILLFCFSFLTRPTSAAEAELKICTYADHQPPYFLGKGTDLPQYGKRGFIVNGVDMASEELNIKIAWVRLAWKRCLAGFEADEFDALLGAIYTEERHKIAQFPMTEDGKINHHHALSPIHYHYYENVDHPLGWLGGSKFKSSHILIGSPRGYIITQTLKESGVPIVESLSPVKGMNRLAKGHLQGYVFAKETEKTLLAQIENGAEKIRRVDPAIWASHLHLPIRHHTFDKSPALFKKLWERSAQKVRDQVRDYGL